MAVFDVSNPASIVRLGSYYNPSLNDFAWDVQASGGLAHLADGWDGLQIIDITNPTNVNRVSGFDTADTPTVWRS